MISGYFLSFKLPLKTYIIWKLNQLLIPYLLSAIALITVISIYALCTDCDPILEFTKRTISACFGTTGKGLHISSYAIAPIGPIWFLWALFWALLIVRIASSFKYGWIAILFISLTGYYTAKLYLMPLSMQAGMNGSLFVLLGYYCQKINIFQSTLFRSFPIQLFMLILWAFAHFCSPFGSISTCQNSMHPAWIITSISATSVIIYASMKLATLPYIARFFQACGQLSLTILCVHGITFFSLYGGIISYGKSLLSL